MHPLELSKALELYSTYDKNKVEEMKEIQHKWITKVEIAPKCNFSWRQKSKNDAMSEMNTKRFTPPRQKSETINCLSSQ